MLLFEPIEIGNCKIKNRIVFPPMTTGYETKGAISKRSLNFYKTIAQGGSGLIVLGDVSSVQNMLPVDLPILQDDSFISPLRALSETVHKEGAKISAQIFHPEHDPQELLGVMAKGGTPALLEKMSEDMDSFCNRISVRTISEIQDKIVEAAVRVNKADFDMIQIHGDRVVGMFSSPILNKRIDGYGRDLEGRARFALELVKKLRLRLPNIPLDYKLPLIRTNPPMGKSGLPVSEAQIMAEWLVDAGVNSFQVCIANHHSVEYAIPPMGTQPYGCFVDLAESIKRVVDVPVVSVGRIFDPTFAENLLKEQKCDMIALGRQLLADPDWPNKVHTGKTDEIRYCIYCNKGCADQLLMGKWVECSINPENGLEEPPITSKVIGGGKRVIVVGGGPAGLEAASTLALRGHQVHLYEKENQLGGQLNIACVPPFKDEIKRFRDFLVKRVKTSGVEVMVGKEFTDKDLKEKTPDAVILATGAKPNTPMLEGLDNGNVSTAWDVLKGREIKGPNVMVVGGNSVGLETALYLVERGKKVTILELLEEVGRDESPTMKPFIMNALAKHGVEYLLQHKLLAIRAGYVEAEDKAGELTKIPSDFVVLATGAKPDNTLGLSLKGRFKTYSVGDCLQPRLLSNALREAHNTALKI